MAVIVGNVYPHCSFIGLKKSGIDPNGLLASQWLSKIPPSPRPPWPEPARRGADGAESPLPSSPGQDHPHSGLESLEPVPPTAGGPPPPPAPGVVTATAWASQRRLLQ